MSSVAVGVGIGIRGRETMKSRKPSAIGVEIEHRAAARTAAFCRRSIMGDAGYNQSGIRISAVVAGIRIRTRKCRETMQGRKTRSIGVDLEHRAIERTPAATRRPIQGVAR